MFGSPDGTEDDSRTSHISDFESTPLFQQGYLQFFNKITFGF